MSPLPPVNGISTLHYRSRVTNLLTSGFAARPKSALVTCRGLVYANLIKTRSKLRTSLMLRSTN